MTTVRWRNILKKLIPKRDEFFATTIGGERGIEPPTVDF